MSFEFKKIILSLLILFILLYQIYLSYSVSNTLDNYLCKLEEESSKIRASQAENNSIKESETRELRKISSQIAKKRNSFVTLELILPLTTKIDPLFPVPCTVYPTKHCRYYIEKETNSCFTELRISINSIFEMENPAYKKVSIIWIVAHLIVLFLLSYILSAIIIYLWRNRHQKITLGKKQQYP